MHPRDMPIGDVRQTGLGHALHFSRRRGNTRSRYIPDLNPGARNAALFLLDGFRGTMADAPLRSPVYPMDRE